MLRKPAGAAGPAPQLIPGDCVEVLKRFPQNHFDACVTDPPYDLVSVSRGGSSRVPGTGPFGRHREGTKPGGGFMGLEWDATGVAFKVETWREVLRVLKPGGHLLAFGGTRTYHRMACAVEDAGFEIRDCLGFAWVYGSGFPKSMDVGEAIDRKLGVERHVIGTRELDVGIQSGNMHAGRPHRVVEAAGTAATSPEAKGWDGWGTALKPAFEPIVLARKPLSEGTVAENVLKWGTGALNINACRISYRGEKPNIGGRAKVRKFGEGYGFKRDGQFELRPHGGGRWPANVVLDEEAARLMDEQSGPNTGAFAPVRGTERSLKTKSVYGKYGWREAGPFHGDRGGASRFFYCAKASKSERGEGNDHPTVKPFSLMTWLLRLVSQPGGLVLDPFIGSGTTCLAASRLGLRSVGIDNDPHSIEVAERRCAAPAGCEEEEADEAASAPQAAPLEANGGGHVRKKSNAKVRLLTEWPGAREESRGAQGPRARASSSGEG